MKKKETKRLATIPPVQPAGTHSPFLQLPPCKDITFKWQERRTLWSSISLTLGSEIHFTSRTLSGCLLTGMAIYNLKNPSRILWNGKASESYEFSITVTNFTEQSSWPTKSRDVFLVAHGCCLHSISLNYLWWLCGQLFCLCLRKRATQSIYLS